MPRFFNTAGPCDSVDHYMLPTAHRLPQLRGLIDQKSYFVLHAPRQVGKTTTLMNLAAELTAEGRYTAVLLSVEAGAAFRLPEHIGLAEKAIVQSWQSTIENKLPSELRPKEWPWEAPPASLMGTMLAHWSQSNPRPLVVFLDEIDALQDDILISVLRQLRSGFSNRPQAFPWSLALVGLRDVRDYKVRSGGYDRLHTASPFNIKARSLTMSNFTADETAALLQQHTADTGQAFTPDARTHLYDLSQGQPWLVNALASVCTVDLVPDRHTPVEAAHVTQAKDVLILRQDTHLDSLAERLREPRVATVMQALLTGTLLPDVPDDDLRYVLDLGLLREDPARGLEVANPIYAEVIPRALTRGLLLSLAGQLPRPTWLTPNGQLDPDKLLASFVAFWRQHGEPMMRSAPYHEAAPHLVLLAFLSKVTNGGGRVEREYAVGSGRMDILVRYGTTNLALELKVWRDEGDPDPVDQGLEQLDGYLDGLGLATGWLVVFDRRPGQPRLAQRTRTEPAATASGRTITVVRA